MATINSDSNSEDGNISDNETVDFNTRIDGENKLVKTFTLLNTNARSLCPKMTSLIENMEETESVLAIVTETWLKDGDGLQDDLDDLREGAGLEMLCRNRPVGERGVAHGGVAIVYNRDAVTMREVKIDSSDGFEILVGLGNIKGLSRKLLVIACYMPPNYTVRKGKDCLSYITDLVLQMKRML